MLYTRACFFGVVEKNCARVARNLFGWLPNWELLDPSLSVISTAVLSRLTAELMFFTQGECCVIYINHYVYHYINHDIYQIMLSNIT